MLEIASFIHCARSILGHVTNALRGSRLVAAGLIAVCTAITASLATASAAVASTTAHATTAAHATASARASSTIAAESPAGRGPSSAQLALLAERAKLRQDGAITGSVAGFDGQPVTGACVTAVGAGRSATVTAAPDGAFTLVGLPAGSYALEYRDCAAAGRYLTAWSGGAVTRSGAARVQVTAGQVRRVPVVTLQPVNVAAAIAAQQASFQQALAANGRQLSATAAAKTGKISGTVTGNGKPLAGICVRVEREGRIYGARTGKNGTYTARNILPGKYYVVFAQASICPSRANWLQQVYKGNNNPWATSNNGGQTITVRAGRTTTGISGDLELGGEITGTVTGKSGAKLHGICVFAFASFGDHHLGASYSARTGANGSFQLHALAPGKYSLHFSLGCGSGAENYAPASHRTVKLSLRQHLTVNQKLPAGASISGMVTLTSSSGSPLQGICVSAFNFKTGVSGFTSTDSDGDYRVIGLTGGSNQLEYYPGCRNNGNYTSVSLTAHTTAGKQTRDVDAVLQVGAKISGTITDSHGNPVSGICAEIMSNNFGGIGFANNATSYSFDRLEPGTYQVGFFGGCGSSGSYAPDWYDNQSAENTATPITLTTGQSFTANAVMQPGATVTGKVTNAAGHGLSGICVSATTALDDEIGPFYEAFTSTRRGTYALPNLAPGQYSISFNCGYRQHYASQWFPGAPDQGAGDLVSVPAGRTSGINAVLQTAGSISGVVTNKAGHPLTDVCAIAINTKGNLPAARGLSGFNFIFGIGGITGAYSLTLTSSHGTFQLSGLPAGRYQVLFGQCLGPRTYAYQWYRGKASPQAATDVTVRAGRTASGIDGRLSRGGTISGHVVNASGKPLSNNICILATNQSTGVVSGAEPGKGGTYTIPGLESGRYTVAFETCTARNLVTVVTQVRVTAPRVTTGVNATMRPGGSIAGVVTAGSSGPRVSGTCVEVYSEGGAEPAGVSFTGLDGSYTVTGLAAGSYQVYFGDPQCIITAPGLAPQWYNGATTQTAATPVSVTVGATTGSVDAALQPDGEITGTVSAGSPATALSGACVTAFPVNGSQPVVAVSGPGGYALSDMLPGQYKVRFSAGCGATGYATQWYQAVASRKAAMTITIVAGETASDISATLSKSG